MSVAWRHYNLDAILAVGLRVRSHRGTHFRQWAIAPLSELLVKGFTMDDERLKNPPGPGQRDYFDKLLDRVRDIRASERRFHQKVLDIYATSVDYQPDTELSQQFFATVQNKMHWAAHDYTSAEIVHEQVRSCWIGASGTTSALRLDIAQPTTRRLHMSMTTARLGESGARRRHGGAIQLRLAALALRPRSGRRQEFSRWAQKFV